MCPARCACRISSISLTYISALTAEAMTSVPGRSMLTDSASHVTNRTKARLPARDW